MRDLSGFFKAGGTLPPGSASYVSRKADREILDALLADEFVFILDSRQKGKSSLIVHALGRLHQEGVTTVRIDLQRLGSNLPVEQWYAGLLHSVGQDLGLTEALFAYWKDHLLLGPMTRWFGAVGEVVLKSIPGHIVFFIDEVDFVQSLPFSADEFFAGIREFYNQRSLRPDLARLTFCLAGVATPAQLIRNEDVTPFNIGRRVELTDFTRAETEHFSLELSTEGRDGRVLLDHIHDWVGGHPYLTQHLAILIKADPNVKHSRDVDALVARIFLSPEGRQQDPNIADVERRLLESSAPGVSKEEVRSQVLEVYRDVLEGNLQATHHDATLVSKVLLSGVAVEREGRLQVRNRLYRKLFNEKWRRASLPEAEASRQRTASRRAARKVINISFAIFLGAAAVLVWLIVLTKQRDQALIQSKLLNAQIRLSAYEASIALAGERLGEGNFLRAFQLVDGQRTSPERRWEWEYLDSLLREARLVKRADPNSAPKTGGMTWREGGHLVEVDRYIVRQDGRVVGKVPVSSQSPSFLVWLQSSAGRGPLANRFELGSRIFQPSSPLQSSLSSDGRIFAYVDVSRTKIRIQDLKTGLASYFDVASGVGAFTLSNSGRFVCVFFKVTGGGIYDRKLQRWTCKLVDLRGTGGATFSPDDSMAALPSMYPKIPIVRCADGKPVSNLVGSAGPSLQTFWSADSKVVFARGGDGAIWRWNIPDGTLNRVYLGAQSPLSNASLSTDGVFLDATTADGAILEWRVNSAEANRTLAAHQAEVLSVDVSPDGSRCATSSYDGTGVLIDVSQNRVISRFSFGVPVAAHPKAFSKDGQILSFVDTKSTAHIYRSKDGKELRRIDLGGRHTAHVVFSSRGSIAFPLEEGGIVTLDNWEGAPRTWASVGFSCHHLAFSPDAKQIAVASNTGDIALLDPISMRVVQRLGNIHSRVTTIEFSPNGALLSVSAADSHIYLFATVGTPSVLTLAGHLGRTWQARFSPDGRRLLSTSFDGTARVWDVSSGACLITLQHGAWVAAAEWSPDGNRIVTACSDGFLRIYSAIDGFELLKLKGHAGGALDVKFLSDGKTIVSVGHDRAVRFWSSQPLQDFNRLASMKAR